MLSYDDDEIIILTIDDYEIIMLSYNENANVVR